jgi:hypothetical protein
MIPEKERESFKECIKSQFYQNGIPENFILFSENECEWNQEQLNKHEHEVDEFLANLDPRLDYFQVLTKENKPSECFQYSRSVFCIKENCSHAFTEDTIKHHKAFLGSILTSVRYSLT